MFKVSGFRNTMIPFKEISGSSEAIGRATGRLLGPWMRRLTRLYPWYCKRRHHDYRTLKHRALDLVAPARRVFPEAIREVEAAARAAKLSFADAWFLGVEEDVFDEAEKRRTSERCTSVTIARPDCYALAHNEDYDGRYRGMVAVQLVRPARGAPFYRFLYPCALPGATFGANAYGIAFAEDSLHFPLDFTGVTKNVIYWAILRARSIAECVAIIRRHRPSNAFALNVVSRRERHAVSIERTTKAMSVIPIRDHLVHANNAFVVAHLDRSETKGTHSRRRLAEMSRLLPRRPTADDAARALASTNIVRSRYRSLSGYMTLATVAADFTGGRFGVKVWGRGRPVWEWWPLSRLSV